jgi:Tol biopolymer transport system component
MNNQGSVARFLGLLLLRHQLSLVVVFALALCGVTGPVFASRIVYRAEQEVAFLRELYLVDLAAPGESVRLNRPLSPFSEGVSSFAVSPDGARIAFSADQDAAGDPDLYLVDITALGSWVRIGDLARGQRELFAKFSPDGRKLAFTASDPFFADVQLYVVDLARPGEAVRVNGNLADGGAVSLTGFEFTPDGSRIVYVAGELERKHELYVVELTAPGQSTRLNAPGGSVGDTFEGRFAIVDAGRVIYSAVGDKPGVRELHLVAIDTPAQPVTLNAPLHGEGDIFDFALSPDGRFVTYTADQDTDSLLEVFLVAIEAPGIATKLNGPVQTGAALAAFTPDGQYVIYAGDEERGPSERDLYRVSVDRPEIRMRLNAPLYGGEDVWYFSISPDAMQVAYAPEETDGFRRDLLVVGLDAPGTAFKVNGPLPDGALDFPPSIFSPAGETIAFIAVVSRTDSVQELFFSTLAEPGRSIRLNPALPKDAIVDPAPDSFVFLPAGAPPTGQAPPGQAPPGTRPDGPRADAGGGGSIGLGAMVLMLAGLAARPLLTR